MIQTNQNRTASLTFGIFYIWSFSAQALAYWPDTPQGDLKTVTLCEGDEPQVITCDSSIGQAIFLDYSDSVFWGREDPAVCAPPSVGHIHQNCPNSQIARDQVCMNITSLHWKLRVVMYETNLTNLTMHLSISHNAPL